ncbi:EthD family reductase [Niveispirillum fermenti]|uniref:EthD family reductase n=1 Tax=Niveispirillum fermenti TaxID=1233113 RepID=UPI003A86CB5F
MKKLIALYRKPDDVEAFLKHYNEVHLPLVARTPGLLRTVINRVTSAPMGGEPAYFMIAEMHFADQDSFDAAMKSPENRAAGKDLMGFARDIVTLLVADVD